MLKHYVEFDTPGSFFPESEVREVSTRIPANLRKIPKYTYAIEYFDKEIVVKNGETLSGRTKSHSKRIIIGEVINQEQLPSMGFGEHTPLYHNADADKKVIKCITGNWQPWDKNWIILPSYKELKSLTQEI
jgi:hypothetical protein